MKAINALQINLAALCAIALVSHDPVTVARAKKVAEAYREEIAKQQEKK